MPRAVATLLHQRFVELSAGSGVDAGPAVFTVVLQTGDVGTEERGELPTAACALALVTHLIIQHVWFHFHLDPERRDGNGSEGCLSLVCKPEAVSGQFLTSLCVPPAA